MSRSWWWRWTAISTTASLLRTGIQKMTTFHCQNGYNSSLEVLPLKKTWILMYKIPETINSKQVLKRMPKKNPKLNHPLWVVQALRSIQCYKLTIPRTQLKSYFVKGQRKSSKPERITDFFQSWQGNGSLLKFSSLRNTNTFFLDFCNGILT